MPDRTSKSSGSRRNSCEAEFTKVRNMQRTDPLPSVSSLNMLNNKQKSLHNTSPKKEFDSTTEDKEESDQEKK